MLNNTLIDSQQVNKCSDTSEWVTAWKKHFKGGQANGMQSSCSILSLKCLQSPKFLSYALWSDHLKSGQAMAWVAWTDPLGLSE